MLALIKQSALPRTSILAPDAFWMRCTVAPPWPRHSPTKLYKPSCRGRAAADRRAGEVLVRGGSGGSGKVVQGERKSRASSEMCSCAN